MSKVYVFTDYGGPENQQLIDRPAPMPGPGEVAIEVRAAGVNPADWKIREGHLGRHWSLPATMGREAAGVVTQVGDGVEDFAVGDEVLGLVAPGQGGMAEHTLLRARGASLPQFARAAALDPQAVGVLCDVDDGVRPAHDQQAAGQDDP